MRKNQIGVLALLGVMVVTAAGQVNVTTWHNDNGRTGQDLFETNLKPANVNPSTFGRVCQIPLSAVSTQTTPYSYQMYAQPLVLSNPGGGMTVYAVTQGDFVYAFSIPANPDWSNPATCQNIISNAKYADLLSGSSPQEYPVDCCVVGGTNCNSVSPTVGILGTPVLDRSTNTLYLVANSQQGPANYGPPGPTCPKPRNLPSAWLHRLHALDANTLAEKTQYHSPVQIPSVQYGNVTFNSQQEIQRPGLLLLPGTTPGSSMVYAGFSLMDGTSPLPSGWLFAFLAQNLQATGFPKFIATTPDISGGSSSGGGIWQGGGGVAAGRDSSGANYIYFTTADGVYDLDSTAAPDSDMGDSFVKLPPNLQTPNGYFTSSTYFTPSDQYSRWSSTCKGDLDFGSGGPMLVPDGTLSSWPFLSITADKGGNIWAIDRSNPGGFNGGSCGNSCTCSQPNNNVETISTNSNFHSTAAYWNNNIYIAAAPTKRANLALSLYPLANGSCPNGGTGPICASGLIQSSMQFGYGASPSISANANQNGIVWAIHKPDGNRPWSPAPCNPQPGSTETCAVLYAFDATNLNDLYNSNTCKDATGTIYLDAPGVATKFSVPTVANGYVIVGTQTDVNLFGLLPSARTCN